MDSVRPLHLSWIYKDNKDAETSCWRKESIIKSRQHKRWLQLPALIVLNREPGVAECCGTRSWENREQKPMLSFKLKFTEGSGLLLRLSRFVFLLVCHALFTRDTMAAAWMVRTDSQQVLASFQCSFILHSHVQDGSFVPWPKNSFLPDFHVVFSMVSRSGISHGPEEAFLSIYPAWEQSQDAGTVCPTTDALTLTLLPEKKVLQISCATSAKSRSAYKKQC